MSDSVIGSCSVCGGAVTVPSIWLGVVPPTPTCLNCGATALRRVIEMVPAKLSHSTATCTRHWSMGGTSVCQCRECYPRTEVVSSGVIQ